MQCPGWRYSLPTWDVRAEITEGDRTLDIFKDGLYSISDGLNLRRKNQEDTQSFRHYGEI